MTTLQTWRHKKQQPKKWRLSAEQLRAKRERADARRMALPAPVYGIDDKPGAWRGYLQCVLDGHAVRIELHQPPALPRGRRPRSDSLQARLDDQPIALGGWTAICRAFVGHLPRRLSRRAIASMEL